MSTISKRAFDAILVGFLLLGSLVVFWDILIEGEHLYGSDFLLYFYAVKKFIRDSVLSLHSLPFWNPYLFSGTPFVTNIQASMFYPLGFIYYLVSPELAFGYSTVGHCMLGSFFMYVFMRGASLERVAGLFSALVFGLNGFFMAHLYAGHLSFVQAYIWIPLVFHFLRRFIETCRRRDIGAAGLVLGVQILAGFPQIAFYTILASLLFVILYGFLLAETGSRRRWLRLILGTMAIFLVGFAAAAVQVLPTLEFTRLSTRAGGVSYAMATYDSLHPKELLAFLMPDLFGNAVDSTYWRSKETWHFWETCGYVGILPLFLAFIKVKEREIRALHRFFVILALVALFLALGKYNPLYPVVYRFPGFNSFRIPAQIIFLYVFAMAVLGGLGMDQILKGGYKLNKVFFVFLAGTGAVLTIFMIGLYIYPYRFFFQLISCFAETPVNHVDMAAMYARISSTITRGLILFSLSLLLLGAGAYGKIGRRNFGILACLVLFADMYLFSSQFIATYTFQNHKGKEDIIARLSKSPVDGRVVTNSSLFQANDGLRWEFSSALGYDPLILRRYVQYILSSQGLPMDDHVVNLHRIHQAKARLLALLHIRQVVTDGQVESIEAEVPYAQVVPNEVVIPSSQALAYMKSEMFDPRAVVVLEGEQVYEGRTWEEGKTSASSCKVLKYEQEKIVIRVSAERKGYLVLSEVYYPGWQAFVNGKRVDVLRANYIFRAIPVEAGDQEVHLKFVSWPFRVGLFVSLMTCFLCIQVILRSKKEPRQ